jgi:hypothetical protein
MPLCLDTAHQPGRSLNRSRACGFAARRPVMEPPLWDKWGVPQSRVTQADGDLACMDHDNRPE